MPFALMHSYLPWQTFAFACVTDESLDGPSGLWDWELEIYFSQKQVEDDYLIIWDELWPRESSGITA